jgi:hypothetical protein
MTLHSPENSSVQVKKNCGVGWILDVRAIELRRRINVKGAVGALESVPSGLETRAQ